MRGPRANANRPPESNDLPERGFFRRPIHPEPAPASLRLISFATP